MKKHVTRIGLLVLASFMLSTSVFAENADNAQEEDAAVKARSFCNSIIEDYRYIGRVGDWEIYYLLCGTVDINGNHEGTHDCVQHSENVKTGKIQFETFCPLGGGAVEMDLDE